MNWKIRYSDERNDDKSFFWWDFLNFYNDYRISKFILCKTETNF
jgi:hypothetical protein